MDRSSERSPNGFGLLANGSSGRWDVAVDESLDRADEWSVQIEGPHVYLAFQPRDLGVVSEVIRFLDPPPDGDSGAGRRVRSGQNEALTLGNFGAASVSLVWDNEDFPRCFVIVGPRAGATMRLSLLEEDVKMLLEAFRQVARDLPEMKP
jgi:hypothetical protein